MMASDPMLRPEWIAVKV